MERVRLTGIETQGRHGAREGETDEPQPFLVDVDMAVEPRRDELETTADYRDVIEGVRALVDAESHTLIETLARRVAETVAAMPGVVSCRAVVHKPLAARGLSAADVSAEATAGEALPHGG